MTDHDLLERMTETAGWAATAPVDPAADLARGRRRLRHRRLGLAATAGFAVAATVTGVSVLADPPAQQLPVATPPPPAARPDTTEARLATDRLANWFAGRVDPGRRYVKGTDGAAYGIESRARSVTLRWQQGAGHGQVAVSVTPPGRYDTAGSPVSSSKCLVFNRAAAAGPPYSCRWTTKDGRRVLIGTSDLNGVTSYFASYVRADGYLALASIEGDRRWAFVQSVRPGGERVVFPPVRDLAVTLNDVVAAVTDPALPLG